MPKTPKEIEADEIAASNAERERISKESNKKRNEALLEARNAIADKADEVKVEEDELEPLTDEIWAQEDRKEGKAKKSRAEMIAEQDDAEERERAALSEDEKEAREAGKLIQKAQAEEEELDEAREAGADDARENEDGVKEYRVEAHGRVEWLTLSDLRARAGDTSSEEDTGQPSAKGAKSPAANVPTPEQRAEARRQAEERVKAEREARKATLKDLYLRASMGDEEAIDALAEMQADSSRVTPEDLTRIVDERVDARVEGKTAFDRAVDWFESDKGYARELAAPGFKQKAAVIDARMAQEHPEWNPRQRLDATGKELRKELADMAKYLGAKPNGTPRRDEPESKLERKRNAPGEVPRAAGRMRPDVEPDEVQSTQEAIQALARGRGQGRPISHKH